MSKEAARFINTSSIELGACWLQFRDTKLKPEGRKRFRELISLIKANRKIAMSEWVSILDGFDYTSCVNGLDCLERVKSQNLLIIGNHSSEGPLRGHGHTLLTSYYVQRSTDQEIRWVHGQDKTTVQELYRKPLEDVLNTIPVREKDGTKGIRIILSAFNNQETVGLYPEGDGNKSLIKAIPTAGKLILIAAKADIPIVCAATGFENDVFSTTYSILDKKDILNLSQTSNDRKGIGQKIVDFVMETIARQLPANRRGYYSYITI